MNRPVRESAGLFKLCIMIMISKCRLINLFLYSCFFTIVFSCNVYNKDSYLKSFEDFVVEIENSKGFSKEELTSIKKKYLDFTETYYNKFESELSDNDEFLIIELKSRYYAIMAKQGLKDVGNVLKDLGEQASDFINEILE